MSYNLIANRDLATAQGRKFGGKESMIDITSIFHPRSIAVLGASSDAVKEKEGWVGRLQQFGFEGKIYPINLKAKEILGLKAYPSVKDVPDEIDFAVFNVNAPLVPDLLRECAAKRVKTVHIFTSGFKESGDPEGTRIEEEIGKISRESSVRVIGPNCMGIYCPNGGVTFGNFPRKTGPSAIVSQTGTGAARLITYGARRGMFFNKVVSYGNAVDLDSTDFIEALSEDPEVKFLGSYIEGVKDVHRFSEVVKRCVLKKPVIMLKVGATEASREAAVSHTGALAGSEEIWQGFFRQSGVIRVYTLDEIVEQMVAFQYFPPPKGKRVGIIGRGGGTGVVATELCEKAGFKVPSFSRDLKARLSKIIPVSAGSTIRNPVEIGVGKSGASPHYAEAFKIIAESGEIDLILTHINPDSFSNWGGKPEWLHQSVDALLNIFETLTRPVALVLVPGETDETHNIVPAIWAKCAQAGLTVFRSYETAAKALRNVIRYHEFRNATVDTGD